MGVNFSSHDNFANLGSFAKVSVPVQSIISCSNQGIIDYTGIKTFAKEPETAKLLWKT